MVTAIVVPIICLYFYWLTKKEMKEIHQKWLKLEQINEEAVVSGMIEQVRIEKQKYYYYKYIYVIEIRLITEYKTIKIKKLIPYTENKILPSYEVGDQIRLYGKWENDYFVMNRVEKIAG